MKRLLTAAALLGIAVFACSMVTFVKVFDGTYNIPPSSNLGKAKCTVCHLTPKGGKQLNPYGRDLQAAMKAAGTKKLSEDILRSVEKLDSDKDGMSNIDEIKADRMPGQK